MLNRLWFVFLCICVNHMVFASDTNQPIGGRSSGMAHATVMLQDVWGMYHNQAGIAYLDRMTFGAHFENKYLIKEASLQAAVFVLPTRTGNFGINITHFGYTAYNQSKFALAYAKSFSKQFAVGIQLDYFTVDFADAYYGSSGAPAVELGLLSEPVAGLTIGAHVFNPTHASYNRAVGAQLPTVLRVGMGYLFSNVALLTVETEKDMEERAVVRSGIEYEPISDLFLRIGISTRPGSYTFGFGYQHKGLQGNFAFQRHPVLGFSTHVSASFSLGTK